MSARWLVLIAMTAVLAALPAAARAQTPWQPALDLYAAASYDEALQALDALDAESLDADGHVAVEQYRMLCLMALGRTGAAEQAAEALLAVRPAFVLGARDASPRVRTMFDATRRRVLPAVARRLYADARRAYDAGDHTRARDGFAGLVALLADRQLAMGDTSLDDLRTLTDGFLQLSAAALEPPPAEAPAPPPAPPPPPPPLTDSDGGISAPVSRPFTPLDIFTYDWRDKDVVPPTPVAQPISGWWGSMGEPAPGTRLGVVDLVIDEHGRVADAFIYQSVNRVYDAVLLASVKQWRYEPATRAGRAVKYRRVTGVVSGR